MSVRFHIGMLVVFLAVIVVFSGVVLFNTYRESSDAARETAIEIFTRASDKILERLTLVFSEAELVADSASRMPTMQLPIARDGLAHEGLDFIVATLEKRVGIYSIYVGHADGEFLQVIAPRGNADVLAKHRAPPETVFIVRAISTDRAGRRLEYWRFLDAQRHVIGARTDPGASYDPRTRPWYGPALKSDDIFNTSPYFFSSLHELGITSSHRLRSRGGVVGVDFAFTNLRTFLERQNLSEHGLLVLFDNDNRLIAASSGDRSETLGGMSTRVDLARSDNPLYRTVAAERANKMLGRHRFVDVAGTSHLFRLVALSLGTGKSLYVAAIGPFSDFTGRIDRMQRRILIVTLILLLALVPLVAVMTRRLSRSLETLAGEADTIQRFEFLDTPAVRSIIREVDQLGSAFSLMKRTIGQRTQALEETQNKLEKLVERAISLSAEKDIQRLYEMVLQTARELTRADGAVLMLLQDDELYGEIAAIGERKLQLGSNAVGALPTVRLTGAGTGGAGLLGEFLAGSPTVAIEDIAERSGPVIDLIRAFDAWSGYETRSLMVAPLRPEQGVVTGLIVLLNAQSPAGETVSFSGDDFGFVESLASQVAIVEELRRHQDYLEEMVERRTAELQDALEVIGDSIRYAARIQRSVLPDDGLVRAASADGFVLWEPRDVVGGDIYWSRRWGEGSLIIVADCTGHGVPGAFMSLIATGALDLGMDFVEPGDTAALTGYMHRHIQEGLGQNRAGGESDDGLELAMLYLPPTRAHLVFTGAGLSLFLTDGRAVEEVKGGRKGLAYRAIDHDIVYPAQEVAIPSGRRIYLTTDGMIDQIGGAKGRSFGKRRFKALIESLADVALSAQAEHFRAALAEYQGDENRRDDVTVAGLAF